MEIIEILEQDKNLKDLNLQLIIAELFENNFLKVVFGCSGEINEENKTKIKQIVMQEIGTNYEVEIDYIVEQIDICEKNLNQLIQDLLKNNYNCNAESISVGENVKIKLLKQYKQTVEKNNIITNIKNLLIENQNEKEVLIEYLDEESIEILKAKQKIEINKYIYALEKPTIINISNIENLYGNISVETTYTIDSFKKPGDEVYICGTVSFLKILKTKPKEDSDGKIIEGKDYYTFYLNDGISSIRVSIFPTQKNIKALEQLTDNMKLVCCGRLDNFNGKLNYNARFFAKCDFTIIPNEEINVPEPEKYLTVLPENYIETSQLSLFSELLETQTNCFLKNKSYVVFDFETTGLDHENDAITELGAVKVVNGKITETFSTFVNPQVHIPEKITQLTHITDDMVKDAPVIEDVLMDFYKFCYNSSLVAHNIDFDFKFLKANARKIGVSFKNKQYDTLLLAREYIKGLKNYKLGTICEYLNIELIDAHRAVNDCLATAKVFIKISDYIKE